MMDSQNKKPLRILAVADIHGKANRLDFIKVQLKTHQVDCLVIAGDIAPRRKAADVINWLMGVAVPVMMVRGNSDASALFEMSEQENKVINLHLNPTALGTFPLVGLGGTIPLPFCSKVSWWEKQLLQKVKPLLTSQSILVTHTPPRWTKDRVLGRFPSGSNGLTKLVDEIQPRLLICGHIHEDAGITRRGKTVVANCSIGGKTRGLLIELDPDSEEIGFSEL